ncbi:BQ2448_2521 [Microbotryum intermedium]|uniref:BQ2448_2521 protein n=1 Tax=Microbotryum intermedium TaxID=269621 RepID=A0A238FBN8_9BASI|nr:BQ2448_2521 [Microbotryum intermedium]
MSFWKFNFNALAVDSIASILAGLPDSDSPAASAASVSASNATTSNHRNSDSTDSASSFSSLSQGPSSTRSGSVSSSGVGLTSPNGAASGGGAVAVVEPTIYDKTLDALLKSPDLLSEFKTGSNLKLQTFLARKDVVLRLGGWVVWGLGRATTLHPVPNGGLVSDDLPDGKVPDDFVHADDNDLVKIGMGGIPRRRDMDEMGVLEGGEPETEQEKEWALFPRLSTEILSSEASSLTDTLFNPSAVSTEPHTCPDAPSFLLPFWETLLGSTEIQLETRSAQVGYWTRVNATLLNGPRKQEVLANIMTIPHLLPRLLALLPYCSPLNDLLLILIRVSTAPSPLLSSIIPQSIRLLDPFAALGKEGHVAAEELLRGCLELGSAVPAMQSPQNGPGDPLGQQEIELEWRDNFLTRQIAEENTVRTLLDWVLPPSEASKRTVGQLQQRKSFMTAAIKDPDDPAESTPRMPDNAELSPDAPQKTADLRTSSLIASIAVFVELIRKNNSDFVEQHMLTWARKKEAEQIERERLEAEGAEFVDGSGHQNDGDDRGPSVVDLSAMLTTVSQRIHGLQRLVKSPRSAKGPIVSTVGRIEPVTLERFRVCEFYAELLHCSNMGLLNRPLGSAQLYDKDGHLAKGWQGADDLAEALQPTAPEDDYEYENYRFNKSGHSSSPTSPINVPRRQPASGISSPSVQGSLDSESGILTREEARELRDLIASAGGADDDEDSDSGNGGDGEDGDDDGTDPFDDPTDDEDLAAATSAISLDADLKTRAPPQDLLTDDQHLGRGGRDFVSRGEDTATTPSAPTMAPLPQMYSPRRPELPPGPMLKRAFLENDVIETMLDMFFRYHWNNLIHNVTFDLIQQIFHGRIDRGLDRQLAVSVFLDGRLIDRILEGHEANEQSERTHKRRLGYMGHMILIAEEIVKLFEHYQEEIYLVVEPHIPQPAWDRYVTTTLRETRDRDLSPLGGGVANHLHDTSSVTSALSDEDDEFPMNAVRALRAVEANSTNGPSPLGADDGQVAGGLFGAENKRATNAEIADASSHDQFSRYLANAIAGDRPDKFGSSDEEEDDDETGWVRSSGDARDRDFALGELERPPKQFGFDDRFEMAGKQVFRSSTEDSDDEGEWGAFTTSEVAPNAPSSATTKGNELFSDDFKPTVASSSATAVAAAVAGFGSSFVGSFTDSFASSPSVPSGDDDEDDFGDFEDASAPSITLPSMDDALNDFDFGEEGRRVESNAAAGNPDLDAPNSAAISPAFGAPRPGLLRRDTVEDGSAAFGGLSSPSSPTEEASPKDLTTPTSLSGRASSLSRASRDSISSPPVSPGLQADLATSEDEPLGHGMARSAHLTNEGMVEVVSEVDGRTIRVPADDIVLAHRRTSMDSTAERPEDLM